MRSPRDPVPGFLENGLEVVLHRVGGRIEQARDLAGREAPCDQLADKALAFGEAVRVGDQRGQFGGASGLQQDRGPGPGTVAEHRAPHDQPVPSPGADPGVSRARPARGAPGCGRPGLCGGGAYRERQA